MAARAFGDQQVGGVALVVDQGQAGGNQLWGLLAVLLATAAWGADNTLSRALAERDPCQVFLGKALLGASATTILALAFGDRRDYALFSVTPPATPLWEVRKLDPEGRNALHTFLQSDTRRFGGLLRQLKRG